MTDPRSDKLPQEPVDTGVLPDQTKSDTVRTPVVMPPSTEGISQYSVAEDLESAIDTGITARTARTLLRTVTATYERDLNRARSELILLRQELEEWKKKCSGYERDCSVLKERAARYREQRTLQNILVTFGGVISGGSLKYIDGPYGLIAFGALILGAAFIVIGWLYPFSKEKEN